MDTSMEHNSRVPPGFRFHPTDEELVGYYLRKKVVGQKIDFDVIRDIDLYRIEPWDLQDKCRIGYEEQREWYFFSHKDKKYPTGTRTNRATMVGFWKATGRDKAVYDKSRLIGMRKTLVFYKGRAPNGHKTDWIMHEYRLESEENGLSQLEEGWVVCRAFKKRIITQTKSSILGWDSAYYYQDEPIGVSKIMSSIDQISKHKPLNRLAENLVFKQETDAAAETLNLVVYPDQFVQLPELDSPPLLTVKKPSSVTEIRAGNEDDNDDYIKEYYKSKNVMDWRDLDRFVASQLSHGDAEYECDRVSSFEDLLTCGEEGAKLNDAISSDCDIGICVFNK